MKLIPYILYLLLVGLHVVITRDLTAFWVLSINLPALLVLLVSLYKRELEAAWFGFAVGIVATAGMPTLIGWQSLLLAAVAVAAFHARERLNLDSVWARLLTVLGGLFIHNVLTLILYQAEDFLFMVITSALLGAIYTTLFGWLFFLIKEGLITRSKVKALF